MKYYICPRCNGNKIIDKYIHVESGICFECSGSGRVTQEEYQRIEKDITKEVKRHNKLLDNNKIKLENQLKNQWFNNADTIYIVDNSNTFTIKNQLKQDGALFNYNFKVWYFTENNNNYDLFTISWDEITDNTNYASNMIKLIKEKSKNGLRGF